MITLKLTDEELEVLKYHWKKNINSEYGTFRLGFGLSDEYAKEQSREDLWKVLKPKRFDYISLALREGYEDIDFAKKIEKKLSKLNSDILF